MRPLRLCVLVFLLACSTPISALPQVEDEEDVSDSGGLIPDSGGWVDGGPHDGGAPPRDFACDVYDAAGSCPPTLPANNAACDPAATTGRCFYPAQPATQLRVAECERRAGGSGSWRLSAVRCSYQCGVDLPQTGNFFSLLTGACATRPALECRTGRVFTSQEGLDQRLRDIVVGCGLPASYQVGVSFTREGCADWLHYQLGPQLTSAQQQCLADELELLRIGCAAACARTPSQAPQ